MNTLLNAANVIASLAGAAAADTLTGGVGSAISAALSMNEVLRHLMHKTTALNAQIATDLQHEIDHNHLTDAQKTLIPQMIEKAPLSPTEVMAAARNPARICTAMLAKMTDPAHQAPALQDAFRRVLSPVLTRLLADEAVANALRPAFEQAVAESLAYIGEQVERLAAQLKQQSAQMGVGDALLRVLARRYAPGSDGDLLQAHAGLEKALEAAQRLITQGTMPSNLDAQMQATLAEVSRLVQDNQLDAADDLLAKEDLRLADELAERTQARHRILDTRLDLARARNDPTAAATHILARLALDAPPDLFAALRAEQDRLHVSGRDQGLAFDLELSILLADATLDRAQTPDQRGAALNDRGNALQTLGARQSDPALLTRAVTAYEQALLEVTRARVPLNWAATQNNLGNALRSLGERQSDPALLTRAVTAFEQALLERTRARVPLDWAATQFNLALLDLDFHTLSPDPAHLTAAKAKARAAREVYQQAGASHHLTEVDQLLADMAAL